MRRVSWDRPRAGCRLRAGLWHLALSSLGDTWPGRRVEAQGWSGPSFQVPQIPALESCAPFCGVGVATWGVCQACVPSQSLAGPAQAGLLWFLEAQRQCLGDPRCPWLCPLLWGTQRGPGFLPLGGPPPPGRSRAEAASAPARVAWGSGLCGVGACGAPPRLRGWTMLVPQDCRRHEVGGGHGWLPSKVSGGGAGGSLGQCTRRACTLGTGPRSFRSDLRLLREARRAADPLGSERTCFLAGAAAFSRPGAWPRGSRLEWGGVSQEAPAPGLKVGGQRGLVASSCCGAPFPEAGEERSTQGPALCMLACGLHPAPRVSVLPGGAPLDPRVVLCR